MMFSGITCQRISHFLEKRVKTKFLIQIELQVIQNTDEVSCDKDYMLFPLAESSEFFYRQFCLAIVVAIGVIGYHFNLYLTL